MIRLGAWTVALAIGCAPLPANAGPIIYSVHSAAGSNAVAGTITTDGKLGVLGQSDITSYLLTVTRDGNSAMIDSSQDSVF